VNKKLIVITRPKPDADKLAALMSEQGFACLVEPLMEVAPEFRNAGSLEAALGNNPQAILVTSKNAVLAFARMSDIRNIRLIAVGKATADYAMQCGFSNIEFAGGTADALILYIRENCQASLGNLLYLRGYDITLDIAMILGGKGFVVDSVMLYRAKPIADISGKLFDAIKQKRVDGVVLFSQNTAKLYVKLIQKSGLSEFQQNITAICISKAVAERAELLGWKNIIVAAKPNLESVVASCGLV